MNYKYLIVSTLLMSIFTSPVLAEPLKLSDAEIKRLHQYFPVTEDIAHLTWKGDPITIQLPLNQEKRIEFPSHVLFDAKNALSTDQIRIINNDKSLYLTALKPISNTRVYVTLQDTNEVVLLDLITSDKATNSTISIDVQQNKPSSQVVTTSINDNTIDDNIAKNTANNDTYVTLIRFAWQQLYAPERLLTNSSSITRVPMHTQPFLSTLVYGDKVIAHPIISWRLQDQYITAIQLRNKYAHATAINVNRDLCGDWQAATLYPRSHLKPAGVKTGDSTTLFLIANKPFDESMEVCNAHA